jgi:hypothetical protein
MEGAMTQVILDLSKFNEDLKQAGYKPLLITSVTFDFRDQEHLDLSIRQYERQMNDWAIGQALKKP